MQFHLYKMIQNQLHQKHFIFICKAHHLNHLLVVVVQSTGENFGLFFMTHLKVLNTVSSTVSLLMVHLLMIFSVSSSLSLTFLTFSLNTSTTTSPDSVARPAFLATQKTCRFSLGSSSQSPLRALVMISCDTPLSF
jgi:hypothetical protein